MRYLKIPDFPTLHGEKAAEALSEFICELESHGAEELTDKQIDVIIKIAKSLISSIQAEAESSKPCRRKKKQLAFKPLPSSACSKQLNRLYDGIRPMTVML